MMGKPGTDSLLEFKKRFDSINKKIGKKQFLTYYIIVAHPGCSENEMRQLRKFTETQLRHIPEQVQIFTPTPSTYSSLMYWTEIDPFTGATCFVEKTDQGREKQKQIVFENGKARKNHRSQRRRQSILPRNKKNE
jgi:radical SAM superfamily enzyme YgiQ (UPF0313 family)